MEELVVALGLLPSVKKSSANITCPVCGHKTLHFDFNRDVFACPACDTNGGVLDAWALFRGIHSSSKATARKLARQDMVQFFKKEDKVFFERKFKPESKIEEKEIASLDYRDEVYSKLLSICSLSQNHRKNLKDRGLNDEQIKRLQIKSFPKLSQTAIENGFKGMDLEGIPGFYKAKSGKWAFVNYGSGILIPEKSVDGKIQGFQVRLDKGEPKYITLSSSKKGGVSCPAYTHFINCFDKEVNEIVLTEGPLKADIVNSYTEVPVVAIPGVNAQKYLEGTLVELKKMGLEHINIAFDMDYESNLNVKKALRKLKKLLSNLEIEFIQYKWDPVYKGYDDFLADKRS